MWTRTKLNERVAVFNSRWMIHSSWGTIIPTSIFGHCSRWQPHWSLVHGIQHTRGVSSNERHVLQLYKNFSLHLSWTLLKLRRHCIRGNALLFRYVNAFGWVEISVIWNVFWRSYQFQIIAFTLILNFNQLYLRQHYANAII